MKKIVLILLNIFYFISCQNYESKDYIENENQAINDLILEMTDFNEMKRLNNWKSKKLKLYLVSTLDTATAWTEKPKGYTISINGIDLSKEKIEQKKKRFESELLKYEKEKKLFTKLKNGELKKRRLNYRFENEKLNIELFERQKINNLESFDTKQDEFGYLFVSRIIFNKNFTKGYLHYEFICGVGCAWDNNVEIKKINGKWKITERFSGGIA